MAKNFTATVDPVADKNPGQWLTLTGTVAAATSVDAGTWNVVFNVTGPNNYHGDSGIVYNKALDTNPISVSAPYQVPASASGLYTVKLTVRDPATAQWQSVTQTAQTFNSPIPVAPVVSTLNKVSGDDQGGTTGQAQAAPMVVQASDASGAPVSGVTINWAATAGTLSVASAVTGADGKASVTLTHAATPQTATVTASTGSLSAAFSQTVDSADLSGRSDI